MLHVTLSERQIDRIIPRLSSCFGRRGTTGFGPRRRCATDLIRTISLSPGTACATRVHSSPLPYQLCCFSSSATLTKPECHGLCDAKVSTSFLLQINSFLLILVYVFPMSHMSTPLCILRITSLQNSHVQICLYNYNITPYYVTINF